VVDLCCYLRDHGRDVTLLTLTGDFPDDYKAPDGVLRERIEIRRAPPSLLHRIWFLLGRIWAVRRKLVSFHPDVVVSFIDQVNILALVSLFGTGIPVVVSERLHPGYNPISRAWLMLRHVVYPLARTVTVQTTDGADWLRRHMWVRPPVVIPNAVRFEHDLAQDLANAPQAAVQKPPGFLLLAVGRLAEQKGFDLLLDAFHRSGLTQAGWHLAILGRGPELPKLERQAAALGITDAVTFPGFVSVGPWLRQADMFVMSSRYEGFPNALMEAMQMQRACISFDCPSGPRDLIENGRDGILVPPQDVAALGEALKRLAGDPELRSRIGAQAGKVAERFSHANVYSKWLSVIDAVATGRSDGERVASFAQPARWQADGKAQGPQAGEG
jgi:GalNAc-alpha-(1->4)-GalNAc-alpha-(1->3)-diNAcBac-PP-undecaprenol alpha-1,4-N-acetyl-D-galactosaminyltransferase